MVNYGVSRGCATCRKFKKRCDEARPACTRCTKARRVCPGYPDPATLIFRNYGPPHADSSAQDISSSESTLGDLQQLEDSALDIFISEFVVNAADPRSSRGFLDGMQYLLTARDSSCQLVRSASLVALALIGTRTRRQSLIDHTFKLYDALLHAYCESLSLETGPISIDSLFTAVLLGLYEIITSSRTLSSEHITHVRGVCSILATGISPFDLETGVQVFQLGNPLLLRSPSVFGSEGVLCQPIAYEYIQSLDAILVPFGKLFYDAEDILNRQDPSLDCLCQLERDLASLDRQFIQWSLSQSDPWLPQTVGRVTTTPLRSPDCAYYHFGPVDRYLDYFVAATWNTYRKSHIMLLDTMARVAALLSHYERIMDLEQRAKALMYSIIASIPYHLASDLEQYMVAADSKLPPQLVRPNKSVGGLLLLHPLFAAARSQVLPRDERLYMSDCLAWIGTTMGIGQGTLLADCVRQGIEKDEMISASPTVPFQQMTEGHILIWAGMLLQPSCHD